MTLIDIDDPEFANHPFIAPDWVHAESWINGVESVFEFILDAPAVDPIKHGRWEISDGHVICSECGESHIETNYCPYCGAKMDG